MLGIKRFGAVVATEHDHPIPVFDARNPIVLLDGLLAHHTLGVFEREVTTDEMIHVSSIFHELPSHMVLIPLERLQEDLVRGDLGGEDLPGSMSPIIGPKDPVSRPHRQPA